jgi:hypothetical protein
MGDIHGQLIDLLDIISTPHLMISQNICFLGNLIDEGEFSIETVFIVFLLKCLYSSNFIIIPGNQEFSQVCHESGFCKQIEKMYPELEIYECFLEIFAELPLAAIIQKNIICVHGGLCPELKTIDQISHIKKPLNDFDDHIVCGLVWSDSSEEAKKFSENPSGEGYIFGEAE